MIKMDEIEKCIADHIEFLETEYGIQSEEGVLISDGSLTTTMLYSTFAEKFECGLFFEDNMPFIRTETGHTVEIKEIEGKYLHDDKIALKDVQIVLSYIYKNGVENIYEDLNLGKHTIRQIINKMRNQL